jgi:hypothetical protein
MLTAPGSGHGRTADDDRTRLLSAQRGDVFGVAGGSREVVATKRECFHAHGTRHGGMTEHAACTAYVAKYLAKPDAQTGGDVTLKALFKNDYSKICSAQQACYLSLVGAQGKFCRTTYISQPPPAGCEDGDDMPALVSGSDSDDSE